MNRHEAVVPLLLEKGTELESKDSEGQTQLLWAAAKKHEAVVQLLLEKGAEPSIAGWPALSHTFCSGRLRGNTVPSMRILKSPIGTSGNVGREVRKGEHRGP